MKTIKLQVTIITLLITTASALKANAQSSGLYLTYNDYLTHTLSYATETGSPNGNKLYIHEFMGHNTVTVISNGKKQVFEKSNLFGYHDADNHDYRFFDNKAYQIVDTTGFFIYSYEKLIQHGKGPKPTRVYFFSKKPGSEILSLTPENIAVAFPQNHKFRYMVDLEAKADIKLDAYDNVANAYKIKELFNESLK